MIHTNKPTYTILAISDTRLEKKNVVKKRKRYYY
jgi:hypothetical protein